MFRPVIAVSFFLIAGCTQNQYPKGDDQSLKQAAIAQGLIECARSIATATETAPRHVQVYDHAWTAYMTDNRGPQLGGEGGEKIHCKRIIAADSKAEFYINFPACLVDGQWRAFGSGYGPVTWATSLQPMNCRP